MSAMSSKYVEECLRISNIYRFFTIYPDRRSALDAFDAGR